MPSAILGVVLIRRETPADIEAVRRVHTAAFASAEQPDSTPVEVGLTDALRAEPDAIPQLSLVAVEQDQVVGHVICSRGWIDGAPALGLGPLGVSAERQGQRVGSMLMHAVLAAADALDEPIVLLLGHLDYYPRFGFRPAREFGIEAPNPDWGDHFQARPLTRWNPTLRGRFTYAAPFAEL